MILNAASPRRSFSIPININLQGARRRQARDGTHTGAAPDQDWSRGADEDEAQRVRTQTPVMSVGEDRAILLGFTMMAFSVLMFFVVGMTVVKPYITSNWQERSSCVLVRTDILKDWVDCRGVSTVPCLRATVRLADSNRSAVLRFDEESVLATAECFYMPKCRMERADLEDEVREVKRFLDNQRGNTSSCFSSGARHPGDVILRRKYTLRRSLFSLLWPCLTLGGGALLVGLVKLTQCLAHLSSQVSGEAAGTRLPLTYSQGRMYRLLRSIQSPA
ncbi:calcium-activated potassium channel subunit beta-3 [Betta splendens]|uniref:Calcium-activated potassium channel subunit beta-3 n=1 Tax=Betta splendens TaxID=158456 RepID=A0A6P7KYI3_BETSP|nr:calcium-activated potassium channel subunit beta-3 [Betta splendens]